MRHKTSDSEKGDNRKDEKKYLADLRQRVLTSLRADIDALKGQVQGTVAKPSYWVRLKPLLSVVLGTITMGALAYYGTDRYLKYSRRKRLQKFNIFRHRESLPKKIGRKAREKGLADSVLDPIYRHIIGLATTSAFTYFFTVTKAKRRQRQQYQAGAAAGV